MRGVNKVIIVGHLGADPEHRTFDNGGSVTNISVATSERWTDKVTGEPKEQTEWHRIVLFNRLAEVAAQYLRKGSQVYIEGSLRTRKYQDQNGQDRYITEIRADNMQMLGGNNYNANNATDAYNHYQGGNVFNNPNQPQAGFNPHNSTNQQVGYPNQMANTPPQNINYQNNSFTNNNNLGQTTKDTNRVDNAQINKTNTMPTSAPVDDDIPF